MRSTACDKIKLFIIFSLLRLTLLSGGNNNNNIDGQVQCSSSYIDDYVLPTAKIALNKIQQSFTPANVDANTGATKTVNKSTEPISGQQQQQPQEEQQATTTATSSLANEQSTQSVDRSIPFLPQTTEPNKSEFVNLDVNPGAGNQLGQLDVSTRNKITDNEDTNGSTLVRVISSTESSSEDPTVASETVSESATSGGGTEPLVERGRLDTTPSLDNAPDEPVEAVVAEGTRDVPKASMTTINEATTTTTTTTKISQSGTTQVDEDEINKPTVDRQDSTSGSAADNSNQITKSADEAVRETELEAIAAVDASIGFGDSFATTSDACYDEYGNARYCEPEFENVAFERQVEVSSECGHPPSRFCTTNLNERNDQIRNCHICDAQHPKKRHPASYLTDINNPSAPTCWVSAPISATASSSSTTFSSNTTSGNNQSGSSGEGSSNINDTNDDDDFDSASQPAIKRDNVTLTINLDKRYEITYISMQFCSLKPDSLAIWKSADFGKSWSAYQFYSSQCSRFYDTSTDTSGRGGGKLNRETGQVEASCVNSSSSSFSSGNNVGGQSSANGRVAFSTSLADEFGQPNNSLLANNQLSTAAGNDKTPALLDWITATNIRIVLDRHQASWIQSSLAHSHHHQQQQLQQGRLATANTSRSGASSPPATASMQSQPIIGLARPLSEVSPANKLPKAQSLVAQSSPSTSSTSSSSSPPGSPTTSGAYSSAASSGSSTQEQQQPQQPLLETSLTNPSDTYNYALSDLAIGGRCKCNGHASRCIHNADGQLQCDCQHNTDGPDCERCLPLHHDRPWQRATQANANPCQPCNCNGHSRKCRFDSELYLLSGKRSGGVCIDCKDNTTGRHCNYCKEGFTRDHTKPMSDQGACKPCDCHPVGSVGKVCNHLSGQCPCKEGVTGLECNRCAPGYQQSSSPTEPCIRLPENDINYEPIIEPAISIEDEQQTSSVVSHQPSNDQEPGLEGSGGDQPTVTRPLQQQQEPSGSAGAAVQQDKSGPRQAAPKQTNSAAASDTNRIDSAISSDELSPVYEQPPLLPPPQAGEFDNVRPSLPSFRSRQKQQQQHRSSQQHHTQWPGYHNAPSSRRGNYLGGGGAGGSKQRLRPHKFIGQNQGDEMLDDELEMMRGGISSSRGVQARDDQDDYEDGARPTTGYRHRTIYYQPGERIGAGGGYADFRQQTAMAGSIRPVASLDHGQIDNEQLAAGGQDERLGYGDGLQDATSAIYAQSVDDANFNQIMRPRYNNIAHNRYPLQQQYRQQHQQQQQQQQQQQHRRRLLSGDRAATTSNLNCAGCQARTKRLNSKQFCHLDYAIRATVISKRGSNDWTRYEVEIQDIFKSPSSSSLLQTAAVPMLSRGKTSAAGADSVLQAADSVNQKSSSSYHLISESQGIQSDDPSVSSSLAVVTGGGGVGAPEIATNQTQAQQQFSSVEQAANSIPAAEHPIHRLKIGSVQSIWVPTEDVFCKCPRLKLRSSYLLMGLVDTRENSATSIQLDRHGVSMVWRPSLQEKLIKYQRLHSDGLCWRAMAAAAAA